MDRTVARGVRAAMASLACLAFDAAALTTVPPPCELCTSTIVAFESTRDGNNEIYVAAPDGTNQRRLTSNPALDESPAVSPDGRRIAFASDRNGNSRIFVVDADGSNLVQVPIALDYAFVPAWSPDGTMLAISGFSFATDTDVNIYVVRLDGTGLRRLTTSGGGSPSWSPDGTLIAFHSSRTGDYQLYTVNVLTGIERRLTSSTATDALPRWSPDGRLIAFASTRAGAFDWDIWVMNPDGSGARQVTSGAPVVDSAPEWSPDGTMLIFERFPDAITYAPDLYSVNLDGTGVTQVTSSAVNRAPSWGPLFVAGANVTATSLDVRLRYRDEHWLADAPVSATGALNYIQGALALAGPAADLGRLDDDTIVDVAKAGNYDLQLRYGPKALTAGVGGGAYFLHTPVTVFTNAVTTASVDLSQRMGIVAGTVTVNGAAPGEGMTLCLDGDHYHWCLDLPPSGAFSVLLPENAGQGTVCSSELVDRGACNANTHVAAGQLLRTFPYDVRRARTTNLPAIAFTAPIVHVDLMYKDRTAASFAPISATGALNWIDGALTLRGADNVVLGLGRMGDDTVIDGLAPRTLAIRLQYGPQNERVIRGWEILEPTTVALVADTTRTVAVDVSPRMGILKGAVTMNGAVPGTGLSVCFNGSSNEYHWCTDLPESGQFSALLPALQGNGMVCSSELVSAGTCSAATRSVRLPPGALLRAFDYRVDSATTRTLASTIAFTAPLVQLNVQYQDRTWSAPAPIDSLGALSWIEGEFLLPGTDTLALDLHRIGESTLVEGLAARSYDLRLLYGPQPRIEPAHPLELVRPRANVTVVADSTTTMVVDVSHEMAIVKGVVTINGAAPGDGLSVCVARTRVNPYRWCTDLPASGQFAVLVPRGEGIGQICATEILGSGGCGTSRHSVPGALNLMFNYNVFERTTTDVTSSIVPAR